MISFEHKTWFARPWGSKVSLSPVLFNKWNWWKLSTMNSFSLPNNINIFEYLNVCKLVPVYSHFVWIYWSSISDNKLLSYSSSLKLLSFFALKLVIWNRYSAISLQLPSPTFTWCQYVGLDFSSSKSAFVFALRCDFVSFFFLPLIIYSLSRPSVCFVLAPSVRFPNCFFPRLTNFCRVVGVAVSRFLFLFFITSSYSYHHVDRSVGVRFGQ